LLADDRVLCYGHDLLHLFFTSQITNAGLGGIGVRGKMRTPKFWTLVFIDLWDWEDAEKTRIDGAVSDSQTPISQPYISLSLAQGY
jgi:hypothetical protein